MTAKGKPTILDVDTGIDDAVAIALACASPGIDLVMVTTVAGNTSIENATRNTLDVLDMLGREDVPVHRGASRPLARPLQDAAHVHGDNGVGGAQLPRSGRDIGADKGPAAIIRMAREQPGALTLICTGPLTNLAIALNVEPDLPKLLDRVIVMGGAYRVQGNFTKAAEFNFFCDPEAASQVFLTPFRNLTAIGLDLTHEMWFTRSMWESAAGNGTSAGDLIGSVLHATFAGPETESMYLHDALAVAVADDSSLIETERRMVVVHTGLDERGAARLIEPAEVDVGVSVDRERAIDVLCGRLRIHR
jgi:purine nucleosidase